MSEFASQLTKNFKAEPGNPAQDEDQLKAPVQRLVELSGKSFGLDVVTRTEALTEYGVRPDIGVSIGELLVGHIELKAPGKGVRSSGFKDAHDRRQFKKLSDHPNLLYTDANEWALYRNGEVVGKVVGLAGDVTSDGDRCVNAEIADELAVLLRDFLSWEPIVPSTPKALAELLAPLTRLLKENVLTGMAVPGSALSKLAGEWREFFFPEADDEQFADAYSQTVTYALLLARVEGETDLHSRAVERLERRHGLLAHVLRWLADPEARQEVEVPVDLLERAIGAIDTAALAKRSKGRDLWLYFYEDFLTAYDPKGRRQRGVYYTPPPVVHAQTSLVDDLLRTRFGKELGMGADDVTLLDPAVGTGTYLLAAFDIGAERVREKFGDGAVGGRVAGMAERFYGFELLVGPYAVSHMRLMQTLSAAGAEPPADGLHVYLTDTLESPNIAPPGLAGAPLFYRKIAAENARARKVKAEQPILVCIGNPPYYRQKIEQGEKGVDRQGGWIRYGDEGEEGILSDFLRDTPGTHAKNLYNLYVYFWRWALWKVFERPPHRGVVAFVTASSYLRGPGFTGMRKFMRESFDEMWILDLGGEGRGARQSENVFDIQTPVAIAIGVRTGEKPSNEPATVNYSRIDGTRKEKYESLLACESIAGIEWQQCFTGWTEPFLPEQDSSAGYFSWPALTDIFPWQHSGVQFKRTWPIAPTREELDVRWRRLVDAPRTERKTLFRESPDRTIDRPVKTLRGGGELEPIEKLEAAAEPPALVKYAFRSLDRQFCIGDPRVCSRPRPPLWEVDGPRQIFLTSLLTGLLGSGPGAIATHLIPDLDHFRGSYGAKHVVPLWRDPVCKAPNLTSGLAEAVGQAIDQSVPPDDLFAYCYAILQAPSYTSRFAEELEIPGPHIPITKDSSLFKSAVEVGRRLIWLHTFAERFVPDDEDPGDVPQGSARSVKAVSSKPDEYPTAFEYDEEKQELRVGDGIFAPVASAVWNFSVSGLHVLGSWLSYRMRDGAGRKSSPLDDIRPETWPPEFTEELLRVIWIIEHTVALGPRLDQLLDNVIDGEVFRAAELPDPTDAERKPPGD